MVRMCVVPRILGNDLATSWPANSPKCRRLVFKKIFDLVVVFACVRPFLSFVAVRVIHSRMHSYSSMSCLLQFVICVTLPVSH